MKSGHDSTVKTKATSAVRSAHRPWAAFLVVALVASLQVLLPSGAHANHDWDDYGLPGLGGAKVSLDNDGYNSGNSVVSAYTTSVRGRGFKGPDVAHIFQCAVGAVDLQNECQLLATEPTDTNGEFMRFHLPWRQTFTRARAPQTVSCFGNAPGDVQCAMVVATFGPTRQLTSKAEHFICWGGFGTNRCQPRLKTSLLVNKVSLPEGNGGTTNAVFSVSLRAPAASDVSVAYTTADGLNRPATAGSDYIATSGTVTIPANTTSTNISVPVIGDTAAEVDETFFLDVTNLSDPTPGAYQRGQATIVNDNDPAPATLSVNDVQVMEGGSGSTSQAIFTVELSEPQTAPFTVRAVTAEYTAHPLPHESNDYVHVNQVLSFGALETTKQVVVTINGDYVDERDETFTLALEDSTGPQRVKRQGVGVITNDDGLPTMSITDVSMAEGNAGSSEARFNVSLSQPSFREIKVDYATIDGSARSSNGALGAADYNPSAGTLIFAPGENTKTVAVVVNGDTVKEQDEEFVVNLSNNINATTTKRAGVGTVRDDDGLVADPNDPTVTIHDVTLNEGRFAGCGQNGNPPCQLTPTEFPFRIELSKASPRPITVSYATADGTARSANHATFGAADYTAASGSVTFAPGETEKTVVVLVHPDDVMEPTYLASVGSLPEPARGHVWFPLLMAGAYEEDFFVQLTSAVNANPVKRVATGNIQNDDQWW